MGYTKLFGWFLLAAGMTLPGVAQDGYWRWRDIHGDRQDLRYDYARVQRMRNDIARDRVRLDEDIRCGREWAARRDAADLARDERALHAQVRDIRSDRRDLSRDYRYGY